MSPGGFDQGQPSTFLSGTHVAHSVLIDCDQWQNVAWVVSQSEISLTRGVCVQQSCDECPCGDSLPVIKCSTETPCFVADSDVEEGDLVKLVHNTTDTQRAHVRRMLHTTVQTEPLVSAQNRAEPFVLQTDNSALPPNLATTATCVAPDGAIGMFGVERGNHANTRGAPAYTFFAVLDRDGALVYYEKLQRIDPTPFPEPGAEPVVAGGWRVRPFPSDEDIATPAGWLCDPRNYGTGDQCDCNCGCLDPDCIGAYTEIYGCPEHDFCDVAAQCTATRPVLTQVDLCPLGQAPPTPAPTTKPPAFTPPYRSVRARDQGRKIAAQRTGLVFDYETRTCVGPCPPGLLPAINHNPTATVSNEACVCVAPGCGLGRVYDPTTVAGEQNLCGEGDCELDASDNIGPAPCGIRTPPAPVGEPQPPCECMTCSVDYDYFGTTGDGPGSCLGTCQYGYGCAFIGYETTRGFNFVGTAPLCGCSRKQDVRTTELESLAHGQCAISESGAWWLAYDIVRPLPQQPIVRPAGENLFYIAENRTTIVRKWAQMPTTAAHVHKSVTLSSLAQLTRACHDNVRGNGSVAATSCFVNRQPTTNTLSIVARAMPPRHGSTQRDEQLVVVGSGLAPLSDGHTTFFDAAYQSEMGYNYLTAVLLVVGENSAGELRALNGRAVASDRQVLVQAPRYATYPSYRPSGNLELAGQSGGIRSFFTDLEISVVQAPARGTTFGGVTTTDSGDIYVSGSAAGNLFVPGSLDDGGSSVPGAPNRLAMPLETRSESERNAIYTFLMRLEADTLHVSWTRYASGQALNPGFEAQPFSIAAMHESGDVLLAGTFSLERSMDASSGRYRTSLDGHEVPVRFAHLGHISPDELLRVQGFSAIGENDIETSLVVRYSANTGRIVDIATFDRSSSATSAAPLTVDQDDDVLYVIAVESTPELEARYPGALLGSHYVERRDFRTHQLSIATNEAPPNSWTCTLAEYYDDLCSCGCSGGDINAIDPACTGMPERPFYAWRINAIASGYVFRQAPEGEGMPLLHPNLQPGLAAARSYCFWNATAGREQFVRVQLPPGWAMTQQSYNVWDNVCHCDYAIDMKSAEAACGNLRERNFTHGTDGILLCRDTISTATAGDQCVFSGALQRPVCVASRPEPPPPVAPPGWTCPVEWAYDAICHCNCGVHDDIGCTDFSGDGSVGGVFCGNAVDGVTNAMQTVEAPFPFSNGLPTPYLRCSQCRPPLAVAVPCPPPGPGCAHCPAGFTASCGASNVPGQCFCYSQAMLPGYFEPTLVSCAAGCDDTTCPVHAPQRLCRNTDIFAPGQLCMCAPYSPVPGELPAIVTADPPPGWTCDPTAYSALDGCNCNCGACLDPDCLKPRIGSNAPIFGCFGGEQRCSATGQCTNGPSGTVDDLCSPNDPLSPLPPTPCLPFTCCTPNPCTMAPYTICTEVPLGPGSGAQCSAPPQPTPAPTPVPLPLPPLVGWRCDPALYNAGDGRCDCDCSDLLAPTPLVDPDCFELTPIFRVGRDQLPQGENGIIGRFRNGTQVHYEQYVMCGTNETASYSPSNVCAAGPSGAGSSCRASWWLGWRCPAEWFNDGDCDCGCGTTPASLDIDCMHFVEPHVGEPYYDAVQPMDATHPAQSRSTARWQCNDTSTWFGVEIREFFCGASTRSSLYCGATAREGQWVYTQSCVLAGGTTPTCVPHVSATTRAGWACPDTYWGTGDGCDCACSTAPGVVDPDCLVAGPLPYLSAETQPLYCTGADATRYDAIKDGSQQCRLSMLGAAECAAVPARRNAVPARRKRALDGSRLPECTPLDYTIVGDTYFAKHFNGPRYFPEDVNVKIEPRGYAADPWPVVPPTSSQPPLLGDIVGDYVMRDLYVGNGNLSSAGSVPLYRGSVSFSELRRQGYRYIDIRTYPSLIGSSSAYKAMFFMMQQFQGFENASDVCATDQTIPLGQFMPMLEIERVRESVAARSPDVFHLVVAFDFPDYVNINNTIKNMFIFNCLRHANVGVLDDRNQSFVNLFDRERLALIFGESWPHYWVTYTIDLLSGQMVYERLLYDPVREACHMAALQADDLFQLPYMDRNDAPETRSRYLALRNATMPMLVRLTPELGERARAPLLVAPTTVLADQQGTVYVTGTGLEAYTVLTEPSLVDETPFDCSGFGGCSSGFACPGSTCETCTPLNCPLAPSFGYCRCLNTAVPYNVTLSRQAVLTQRVVLGEGEAASELPCMALENKLKGERVAVDCGARETPAPGPSKFAGGRMWADDITRRHQQYRSASGRFTGVATEEKRWLHA